MTRTSPDPVDQAISESFPASDPPSWAGQSAGAKARESLLATAAGRVERAAPFDVAAEPFHAVSRGLNHGGLGPLLRGEPFGHAVHPWLTDLPLGCWTAAGLLDLVGGDGSRRAATMLVGAGVLTSVPTAMAGFAEFDGLTTPGARRVAILHGLGNLIVVGCYLNSLRGRRRGGGVGWSVVGAVLALATAYLGGHLSYVLKAGQGSRP